MESEPESIELLQSIFVGVLLGLGMVPIIAIPIAWYAAKKARARRQLLEEIERQYAWDCLATKVRYCTDERFRKFWKFFPWEGVGILVRLPYGIVFHGWSVLEAKDWHVEFESTEVFQYIGRVIWPNGPLAWIMAKANDGTLHYFSSETGTFAFGSKSGTAKVLLVLK